MITDDRRVAYAVDYEGTFTWERTYEYQLEEGAEEVYLRIEWEERMESAIDDDSPVGGVTLVEFDGVVPLDSIPADIRRKLLQQL